MRMAIKPRERLSTTLAFLGTGQSFKDLEYKTRTTCKECDRYLPLTNHRLSEGKVYRLFRCASKRLNILLVLHILKGQAHQSFLGLSNLLPTCTVLFLLNLA